MIFIFLGLIILLCSMLQYPCKLCVVKHTILDRCLPVHLIHVIISKPVSSIFRLINLDKKYKLPVSDGGQQLPQSVLMDQANIVLIKTSKCIFDDIFWVCALEPFTEEGEEHGEIDWSRSFTHHAFQVLFSWILAKGG